MARPLFCCTLLNIRWFIWSLPSGFCGFCIIIIFLLEPIIYIWLCDPALSPSLNYCYLCCSYCFASASCWLWIVAQYIPSPFGFPLPQNIGKGYNHGLTPNICFQFSLDPISYMLLKGLPYLSKFSIVVLFCRASFKWNLRNAVISTQTMQSIMKAIITKILLLSLSLLFAMNLLLKPQSTTW